MKETDRATLQEAKALLENPSLAARLVNVVGRPIEEGLKYLPERVRDQISDLTRKALLGSLKVALSTVNGSPGWQSSRLTNKLGAAAAGGVGGFFGVPGLAVELPVSTTIMMRAIATIARENGEDTEAPETRMACLEVFALGGRSESDDGTETGYYAVRAAMAKVVGDAVAFLAKGERDARREGGAGALAADFTGRGAVFDPGHGEGGGAGAAGGQRGHRRRGEHAVHQPLPGHGHGPLHRPEAGAEVRAGDREGGLRRAAVPVVRSARALVSGNRRTGQ